MQSFTCPRCGAAYTVSVQSEPAEQEPKCEDCETDFPDNTDQGWLHYGRQSGAAAAA